MVQPNTSVDELASLTIANFSDDIRDNVTNDIPTWFFFEEVGAIEEEGGGTVLSETLDFADNSTFTWYNGYEEIPTTPSEVFTRADFDWKECGCNIAFSARELAINAGREEIFNLAKGKATNAEKTMRNNAGAALYYAGTEFNGKAFGGMQYIIPDDPSTGTVGGINRATVGNEWWRSISFDATDNSITLSSTTIQQAMERVWTRVTRGMDSPKLVSAGETLWGYFSDNIGGKERYVQDESASGKKTGKMSFPHYMFKTAKVFHEPNAVTDRMFFMNTDFLKVRVHRARYFKVGKPIQVPGQRASITPVDLMGNVVCGNASLQAVLKP